MMVEILLFCFVMIFGLSYPNFFVDNDRVLGVEFMAQNYGNLSSKNFQNLFQSRYLE